MEIKNTVSVRTTAYDNGKRTAHALCKLACPSDPVDALSEMKPSGMAKVLGISINKVKQHGDALEAAIEEYTLGLEAGARQVVREMGVRP